MRMLRVVTLILSMFVVSVTANQSRAQSGEAGSPIVDIGSFHPSSGQSANGNGFISSSSVPMTGTIPVSHQTPLAAAPSQLNGNPNVLVPRGAVGSPYAMPMSPNYAMSPGYFPQAYGPMPQMGAPPMGMPPMYGGVMPAMYGEGAPPVPQPGYGESGGEMGGEMGMCPYCGGQGCEYCQGEFGGGYGGPHHPGVLAGALHWFLPYAEGGRCAPRWYDITGDVMYMKRAEVGERVEFTYFTRLALGGTVVLSTDNLKYEEEFGLRLTGSFQVLPGANVELTYFGLFNWDSFAAVADPTNNLFSVYSGFGENPVNGFDETDQSQLQSLRAGSTLDNFEINLRKRWQGPNCRLQGSWLFGFRYVYLIDDLDYFTLGRNDPVLLTPVGQSDTFITSRNNVFALQLGGDLWANIVPGVSLGADLKAGVGGVRAKYSTMAVSTNNIAGVSVTVAEEDHNNDIAGIVEGNLMFIWRLNPNWTLRGGFSAMYVDGVSLSLDNFNPVNPFVAGRTVRPIDDNGTVFYHGGFAGLEWMW